MMTIEQFGRRLRAGELTAVRVTEECLRRIEADNPRLNAFILVMADEARATGARSRPGACGRPRSGAAARRAGLDQGPARYPRRADDRGVARARGTRRRSRRAGDRAPAPGRRGLHRKNEPARVRVRHDERGLGVRPGAQPARPVAVARADRAAGRPRASSTGMALATIGTDTGGSIRIPAAACGLVGLKPSMGEVSIDGVVPLSRTLDHVGPLAASVADASIVYHALLGDARTTPARADADQRPCASPSRAAYFCDLLDDDVRARFEGALDRLRTAGAHVDDIEIRHAADIAAGLSAYRVGRCGGVPCHHARDGARALHRRRCACGSKWVAM